MKDNNTAAQRHRERFERLALIAAILMAAAVLPSFLPDHYQLHVPMTVRAAVFAVGFLVAFGGMAVALIGAKRKHGTRL